MAANSPEASGGGGGGGGPNVSNGPQTKLHNIVRILADMRIRFVS